MIKFKLHIACLLLCLFVFPILFQPLHVMLYHSLSGHAADHHCCSHKTCETSVKHKNTDGISLTGTDEDCPICNYHFATKDFQDITVAEVHIPMFTDGYNAITHQENYLPAIGNKSPRAPPVHIS